MQQKWEITISEYKTKKQSIFKVTRRFPELRIAETKMFNERKKALTQIEQWSQQI